MAIRFGPFVLDPRRRQFFRGEIAVHLTPKAFDLLAALVERRPEAVPREHLESRIWGGTHVAETSLAGLVAEVRAALGDRARDPVFVRTVHGFGYAFCGDATAVADTEARSSGTNDPHPGQAARVHRLSWARREVTLREGRNVLGRDPEAAAWLDSPTVSRRHACIVVSGDEATVEDLGSHNGTFVGGDKVEGARPLHDRDQIRLGAVTLTFRSYVAGETESQVE